MAVIPARVRKPQDKAKVENAVQNVERRILATFRNRTFFSLDELNHEIKILLEKLNNEPFQKLEGSRKSHFIEKEKQYLKLLPKERFEFTEWKKAKVHIDYHVELEGHYYSVPYKHVKKEVEICYSKHMVSIFKNNKLIARHKRNYERGKHTVIKEHMPQKHQKYLEWTPSRIISWARSIGVDTATLIEQIFAQSKQPALEYRKALGIISLAKQYGNERLENACRRLLKIKLSLNHSSYKSIKSILENNLDKENNNEVDKRKIIPFPQLHENVRGKEYFNFNSSTDCNNGNNNEEENIC